MVEEYKTQSKIEACIAILYPVFTACNICNVLQSETFVTNVPTELWANGNKGLDNTVDGRD